MRSVSGPADAEAFRREHAARRAEQARRVAAADFPLYGLPVAWSGVRVLSGASWRTQVPLTSVELTHVAPPGGFYDRSTARLVVVSGLEPVPGASTGRDLAQQRRRGIARDLRGALDLPAFPADARSAAERRAWLQDPERALAAVGSPRGDATTLPVDGADVEFARLALGDVWVGAADLGDHPTAPVSLRTLRVQAYGWDLAELVRLGLTRLADLGPYLAGRDALPDPWGEGR